MFPRASFLSRRFKGLHNDRSPRKPRRLALEPLQGRQMLSATPFDLGADPGAYSADEFLSAAVEYGKFTSSESSLAGPGGFQTMEYSMQSDVSYDNHSVMARFEFVFYATFNTVPTAEAGGPYTVVEGESLTLDGSGSQDPDGDLLNYSWDVNGDGQFGDAVGASPTLDWSDLEALGIADDGQWTVTLRVDDGYGGSAQSEAMLTVENAAPKIAIVSQTARDAVGLIEVVHIEGSEIGLRAEVSDPGRMDTHVVSWTVTKDGESYQSGDGETFQFTPDDNGLYQITSTVTDDDGGTATATSAIDVANADPSVAIAGVPQLSVEGTEISLGAEVTDPGTADTHNYVWQVTKDGQSYVSGQGDAFQFTPDDNGSYQVTVTVTDDDGAEASATELLDVGNADPVAAIVGVPESTPEGTEISLSGEATDPGSADTHTFSWQVTRDGEVYDTGEGSQLHFTPDDNGIYQVTLRATDDDGGSSAQTAEVLVDNVAPQLENITAPELAAENEPVWIGGEILDPGSADTFALEVDWGDGTTDTFEYAEGTLDFEESHAYANGGIYTVNLTLVDDDGGTGTGTQTAMVTGVGLHDGRLQVVGSSGDDHVFVGRVADGRYVVVSDLVSTPWQPRFYEPDEVEQVDMRLGLGDDMGVMAGNVDLPAILVGGNGDDHLVAAGGDDVVLGGSGDDVVIGGRGANLLIGGEGADVILGGFDDDLVVTGTTALDDDEVALAAIMAEWTSGRDLDSRAANLSGRGEGERLNADYFLTAGSAGQSATVLDDGAVDLAMGGPGGDWFFSSGPASGAEDHLIDATSVDLVDELDLV